MTEETENGAEGDTKEEATAAEPGQENGSESDRGALTKHGGPGRNIDAMLNVGLQVQIILGRSRMPIAQLLKLTRGSVIELDKKIGDPVEVMINDRLVARGDLIKLPGDRLGVSLTEIVKDYVSEE